ncbi:MAG: monofunctional biosynthetic peptidoglycan transglycosylase [Flavobacteriales bacterium]|nr:monofunctional biosynthetic peptidoglycan transglycosylase [Flavobacteriales bacterium]
MKKLFRKILKRLFKLLLAIVVFTILQVVILAYVNPPITTFMIYQYFTTDITSIQKDWHDIENISPNAALAVIASEDQKFLEHHGFDVEAIQTALERNKESKRIRGASTISQQLAKNLFLIPSKNFLRKGVEAYYTVLIELIWSKKRIMEVYLNVVELGEGIYGVPMASQQFFKKSPKQLSSAQAALIATALPNPKIYKLNKPSSYMYNRQFWVQRQMRNLGGTSIIQHWYE